MGKSARKLILQFHGGGESEKTWFESTGLGEQVRQSWRNSGIQAPSIVSVSFGPMWLLSNRSLLPQSGLYEVFVNEIFPYIEKQLMNGRIDERILIGHSMGGFNLEF
jgi:enterochelin esterase-like enzyme